MPCSQYVLSAHSGLIYRTILAALHFNHNLNREGKKDKELDIKLRVTYPKFKNGEGTVREVRQKQNFSMLIFVKWTFWYYLVRISVHFVLPNIHCFI